MSVEANVNPPLLEASGSRELVVTANAVSECPIMKVTSVLFYPTFSPSVLISYFKLINPEAIKLPPSAEFSIGNLNY